MIAGIDYSINCPSVCIYDDTKELNHENCLFFVNQHGTSKKERKRRENLGLKNIFFNYQYDWTDNYSRYFALADWVLSILIQYDVKIVCLEDYAIHAQGLIFNIAEATGILRNLLHLSGFTLYTWPPTLVKKVFTTKGNAQKATMCMYYDMKYNVSICDLFDKKAYYDSPVSDIVDSHAMIYTYYNVPDREQYKVF